MTEDERAERMRNWVLNPPRSARMGQPRKGGLTYCLDGEPDLFDLPAWRQRLATLRSEEPCSLRDDKIEYAEAHVRAIGGDPGKSPADGL